MRIGKRTARAGATGTLAGNASKPHRIRPTRQAAYPWIVSGTWFWKWWTLPSHIRTQFLPHVRFGRPSGGQPVGRIERNPVQTKQIAHRRPRPDADQCFVPRSAQHLS